MLTEEMQDEIGATLETFPRKPLVQLQQQIDVIVIAIKCNTIASSAFI
jgi:hypothetical protein